MRPRVNLLLAGRTARGALASALLVALAAGAQEPAPGRTLDERWIPSFAITSGVFWGRQHATVSSDCTSPGTDTPTTCNPAVGPGYGSELRKGAIDDELAVTPYVGGNLSLATPVLLRTGRPRLFAGLELPYQFGIDRNVAQQERPTGIAEPENPNATEFLDETALLGVGSRTRTEIKGLAFGADAGVSFSFEAFGRQFHVKPRFAWVREQIGVRGRIEHGLCPPSPPNYCDLDNNKPSAGIAFTRVVTVKGHDSIWLNGIGPGLDFEMETGRFGPYTVALFVGGGGYYLLGDRSVSIDATQTIGPDQLGDAVDYRGHFTFRANPWIYRGGLGLRLSWVGYD
jgi:hypothetical protein